MKFSREVISLAVVSTPYILNQPFQNGGCSNFWSGYNTCTSQCRPLNFVLLDEAFKYGDGAKL